MADYSTLQTSILNQIQNNVAVRNALYGIAKKCQNQRVSYRDIKAFATLLGGRTSRALLATVEAGNVESLKAFGVNVVGPVYTKMQTSVIDVASQAQKAMNTAAKMSLNPAKVVPDASRIENLVQKFATADNIDKVKFLLGDRVAKSILNGAVTDTLKANADLADRAGFNVVMSRIGGAECCAWCDSMSGVYEKGEEPVDFWRIHNDCTCEITYRSSITGVYDRITFDAFGKNTESLI